MSLNFKVESTHRRFDTASWVQVYEFGPKDPEVEDQKGYLICTLEVTVKDAESLVDPSVYGKKVLNILHQEYYGSVGKSAFVSLTESLRVIFREVVSGQVGLSAACLVCVGRTSYVGAFGGAKVSIMRNGGLAHILSGSEDPVTASGFPEDGDLVILSVGSATRIDNSELVSAFSMGGTEANKEISQTLDSVGGSYALGAVRFGDVFKTVKMSDLEQSSRVREVHSSTKQGFFKNLGMRFTQKRLRVERANEQELPKQKKSALLVGILIIALLVVSIVFGMMQKAKLDELEKYSDRLAMAQSDYEEALGLYGVSPTSSRSKFLSSKQVAEELLSEGVEDENLNELIRNISENEGRITGIYMSGAQLFVDLSLLSDDFGGVDMASDETNLYVLSSMGNRVARVSFPGKRSEIVVGPQVVRDAKKVSIYGRSIFYINEDGLFDASENEKIQDRYWDGEALLSSYAGNVYVLDKSRSVIYRHSVITGGYADPSEWTKEGANRDFSQINSWSIDGFIWLLSSSGRVAKYSLGVEQNFSISGVEDLKSPVDIYTNESIDNLYILDSNNSRVVVLNKEGEFISSYINELLGGATKISASESDRLIFFLAHDKIYSIDLRHLD